VYAKGDFSAFAPPPVPILPDWSPTHLYNGYSPGAGQAAGTGYRAPQGHPAPFHQCAGSCGVHGHAHDAARRSNVPVTDYTAFWGALGCSCFAF
jgi:hypothetical protein